MSDGAEQADRAERALGELLTDMTREFPRFRIVDKQGDRLSRLLDLTLRAVTLGGQREYLTRYHTVLGDTLYVPPCWHRTSALERIITLRHERVHLRQRRRLGGVGLMLLYLLPIFPLGLALGRARLEWEAYHETLRATAELRGPAALCDPALREHVLSQFTSAAYGWMWPFRHQVERWYDDAVDALLQAHERPEASSSARSW